MACRLLGAKQLSEPMLVYSNKPQWNSNRNLNILIQESALENVVWKMAAISSRPPGLDTYFFPNLAVGQPSDNMDLSEIDFYLGKMMIFYFFAFVTRK